MYKLILLAAIVMAPKVNAQISETPGSVAFEQAHPDTSFFYAKDGRISRVYGKAFSEGNSPSETAKAFINDWASIWNCDANDLIPLGPWGAGQHMQPMMYDTQTGKYKFTGVGYMQTVDGIPVYDTRLTVLIRNESNYPAVHVTADLHPLADFKVPSERPRQSIVLSSIQQDLPNFHTMSQPELWVFAGTDSFKTKPVLAFVTEVSAGLKEDDTFEKWLYFVNALSGEIIYRENRILNCLGGINGNVSANVTQSSGADECEIELPEPMPYALVTGGGESTYTDVDGNYTLSVTSPENVTISSDVSGYWFNVNNQQGDDSVISIDANPAEDVPVDFAHNSENTEEFYRAEVNAYIESNIVRDFVLAINPDYPTIGTQTNWPVNVNLNSSCNAYYDYSSINFYSNTGGCNNTAFSVIVHHEYGHHLVAVAGSGQGEYGEGMGDVMGLLITGDPFLARGFYEGNCATGIRNADNNCLYSETNCSSCGSQIHSCGQLISGCVWDMLEYFSFTDAGYDIVGNLAVNSIMLHSGTDIDAAIAIDYLTLDDDDSDIGNGTPNYQAIEYGFEAHDIDVPQLDYLTMGLVDELPNSIDPAGGHVFKLAISSGISDFEPNSAQIFFADGNGLEIYPLSNDGLGVYSFETPPVDCGNNVSFWFTAETTDGVIVFYPDNAPEERFNVVSANDFAVAIDDDFEQELGWVVAGDSPTGWERGAPQQAGGDWIPHADYDGSGQCYVTGNQGAGGGHDLELTTTLTSPVMDASEGGTLSYAYWLSERPNNPHGEEDDFQLLASYDGVDWFVVIDYDDYLANGGWRTDSVEIEEGGLIEPSSTLQIQFLATDLVPDNRIEAGIDAVSITGIVCDEVDCAGDVNGDSVVNVTDILIAISDWGLGDSPADVNEDGIVNVSDVLQIINAWGECE